MSDSSRAALETAERIAASGDPRKALEHLAPWLGEEAGVPLLWRGAELAEQAGDPGRARELYERVLATDFDHPGARERVRSLAAAPRPAADPGATVLTHGALASDRYRIVRELGRGGAGTVFLAQDQHVERHVALKIYHRRGPGDRRRLRHEAQVPATLGHPGVIRIFDVEPGLGAIAMEVVGGGSLAGAIRVGAIRVARARGWIVTLVEALRFVHGQGWVHRDVKPSNVLLREGVGMVLTDFGLAMRRGEALDAVRGQGTAGFMSPEEGTGAAAQPSGDVYALGATLERVLAVLCEPVPEAWRTAARACRSADPEARPSMQELARLFA